MRSNVIKDWSSGEALTKLGRFSISCGMLISCYATVMNYSECHAKEKVFSEGLEFSFYLVFNREDTCVWYITYNRGILRWKAVKMFILPSEACRISYCKQIGGLFSYNYYKKWHANATQILVRGLRVGLEKVKPQKSFFMMKLSRFITTVSFVLFFFHFFNVIFQYYLN